MENKIKKAFFIIRNMDSNLRKNLQTDKGYIHEEKLWENTYIRHQADRRKEGGHFSVEMHIRGMVYAMFGSKIPWKSIKHDIDTKTGIMHPVDDIFHNYNAEILLKCDTDELADALKEIGCKGKSVRVLVDALIKYNIPKLLEFEEKYGSIDDHYKVFADKDPSMRALLRTLSGSKSANKMQKLGASLAAEYLRNVGYDIAKTDRSIRRIIGSESLGFSSRETASLSETYDIIAQIAKRAKRSVNEINNILELYQDKFVNKSINVLSCSTTFEMGVDVGDLETVFMKNMPPSPANYIQRAGRAGRRTDSAAYALTFCRLSSHDLNFYRYPEKMIKGHILPPSFKVTYEKIVQRHLNACCLSEFFRLVPESFSTVDGFVLSEYYGKFREFIESRPDGLMKILYDSIPYELHSKIEKWLDELVSDDGKLYEAYLQTVSDIEQLENYAKELVESGSPQDLKTASNVGYAVNTIKDTDILSFLSRKSILPKYGFPVDSVELFTSPASYGFQSTSKLRLSRDLAIAIAEYAPDSEIVADGKLYKSRYIKLPPRKNHALIEHTFAVCTNPECGCINTALNRSEIQGRCRICNSEVEEMGSYIIPQYGFVSEIRSKNATTKKPDRTYRGDVHYIGNSVGMTEEITINDVDISVTKTKDDELLIMNRTPFYMCRSCGYAVRKKGGINEISRFSKEQHRTTEGRPCANKTFDKVYLGHELKTDVAIISISKKFEKDQALSVLYALLEGVSAYYSIERKDISGCLYYSRSGGNLHTVFVLYDTVPGGAGHVSRIASGSADGMKGVLKEAYKVVADCTCGGEDGNGACYSCLCNYENQRVHDRLNRGLAKKYLGEILGEN